MGPVASKGGTPVGNGGGPIASLTEGVASPAEGGGALNGDASVPACGGGPTGNPTGGVGMQGGGPAGKLGAGSEAKGLGAELAEKRSAGALPNRSGGGALKKLPDGVLCNGAAIVELPVEAEKSSALPRGFSGATPNGALVQLAKSC